MFLLHTPFSATVWNAGSSRRTAVTVQAKLVRGNQRPDTRKKSSNPKKVQRFELNLQKLCTDAEYLPDRQIGPVELAVLPGRGRSVVTKEDVGRGSLLFVSEPIASVVTGQLGQEPQSQDLLDHWKAGKQGLSDADRYKLSLLHCPSSTAPPPAVTFKDFSSEKASSKAKKAAASSKGFGAAAKPSSGSSGPAAAAAAGVSLSEEQLQAVISHNAFGDDHLDGALTSCRDGEQQSVIGIWPELALMNHSCAPNTVSPVLLSNRLLLRSAVSVPAGEELSTSYLGLAGGMPLKQRRKLLQHYGFICCCPRCKAEEAAPADIQSTLQAMYEWSSTIDTPQLLQRMSAGDKAGVQQLHDKASTLVQQLEQQLQQVTEPVAITWLKASAYGTYAVWLRAADWLSGLTDLHATSTLASLVQVFAPGSEPHLLLLADSAVRAEEAARRSGTQASDIPPEDTREVCVARFVQAVNLRYGQVQQMDVLTALASSVTHALGPHWLGLIDMDGQLGLRQLMQAAGAQQAAAGEANDAAGGSKRKVELNLQQLGQLGQEQA